MSIYLMDSIEEIFNEGIEVHAKMNLLHDLIVEESERKYEEGRKYGYDEGYEDGHDEGYEGGYDDGESALGEEAYREGYEDGFKKGLTKGIEQALEELNLSVEQTEVIKYLLFKAERGWIYAPVE